MPVGRRYSFFCLARSVTMDKRPQDRHQMKCRRFASPYPHHSTKKERNWNGVIGVARIEISFCSTSEVTHVDSIFFIMDARNISKCKWELKECWMHSRAMNIIEIRIIFHFHTRAACGSTFRCVQLERGSHYGLSFLLRRHAIDEFYSVSRTRAYMLMTFHWIVPYVGWHGPTSRRVRAAIVATAQTQTCEILVNCWIRGCFARSFSFQYRESWYANEAPLSGTSEKARRNCAGIRLKFCKFEKVAIRRWLEACAFWVLWKTNEFKHRRKEWMLMFDLHWRNE